MLVKLARIALAFTVVINIANASYCSRLQETYSPGRRYLSINGTAKSILLYWGSEPSHAASALFQAILRYAHGYQHVHLVSGPHSLRDLADSLFFHPSGEYNNAILALSTAWEYERDLFRSVIPGDTSGLAGPRLQEIGVSTVPSLLRLHVYLANKYKNSTQCHNVAHWNFFTDFSTITECGFITSGVSEKTVVFQLDTTNRTNIIVDALKARANASRMLLQFKNLDRKNFLNLLRAGNQSFLFIDYDMWLDEQHITAVQLPPCLASEGQTCLQDLDNAVPLRAAEVFILSEHAPQLFMLARTFRPSVESIKFIFERITSHDSVDIEEAACEWASKNYASVYKWVEGYKSNKKKYDILVFSCSQGPNKKSDLGLAHDLKSEIYNAYHSTFSSRLLYFDNYCSDINFVKSEINYYMSHGVNQRLIGAVVGGTNKVTEAAKALDGLNIPVILFDTAPAAVDSTTSVWLSTGRLLHLALAIKQFIYNNNWSRVAVLSEPTLIANRFVDDLKNVGDFALGNHKVKQHLSQLEAEKVLKQLMAESARIIIVNTNYEDAVTILLSAVNLNMNAVEEYAWIVREWQSNDKTLNIKHFTFSFSCPSGKYVSNASNWSNLRQMIDRRWSGNRWPSEAGTLVDAVISMAEVFQDVVRKYPKARDDLHSTQAIRVFQRSFVNLSPIQGLTQNLKYKGHSLEEATVFLEEWHGSKPETLMRWRVNATAGIARIELVYREPYSKTGPPHDGAWACIVSYGDPYQPTCFDSLWIVGLLCVTLALPVLVVLKRYVRRHIEQSQKRILLALLAKRQLHSTALSAGYLIDRSTLELRNDLGSGRFGCVRLALMRVDGRKSRFVAAKTLREDQDEIEILREACTLASLDHPNIIRLVGVCIDEEPPVVLMEVAFFGDLLQYLRDRQYLAEGAWTCDLKVKSDNSNEEAVHVSSEAITRLARQAASALEYLYLRGVIHRDLRASNCLVDANRSLKLADFGLARETMAKGMDGGGEYACRRRGLFPVLWMAPESLVHGIFSTASDMWAFGVLVYELVTLGARPYGDMSPQCVMRFVSEGGEPPMPSEATTQTTNLTRMCWRREPDQRPTAAEVVAYLTERPSALRPALDSEHDHSMGADNDSAYSESPAHETLLPC